ncbi:MAG: hypothetical protein ABIF85_06230 [Nanoarchaeota archaeon]
MKHSSMTLFKIVLFVVLLVFWIAFPIRTFAANPCNSVYGIYENIDTCDRQEVFLRGIVKGLDYSTSAKGNDYTTFLIDDGTATPLKVFSYEKIPISDGETVSVRGNFTKALNKSGYIFYEQITTSQKNVFVAGNEPKESGNGKNMIAIIVIFLLVIAGAFVAYRKYRKTECKIENHVKGASFEDYVQRLFDQRDWTIADKTKDLSGTLGRKVESDKNPDFLFRHNATGKTVAVECKYRAEFSIGKNGKYGLYWAKEHQMDNYREFQERMHYPVFVAIGVGGTASAPKQLFLAPLYMLKYRWAVKDYLERIERNPVRKIGLNELELA